MPWQAGLCNCQDCWASGASGRGEGNSQKALSAIPMCSLCSSGLRARNQDFWAAPNLCGFLRSSGRQNPGNQGSGGQQSSLVPALGFPPLGSPSWPPCLESFSLAFFGKLHQDTFAKLPPPRSLFSDPGQKKSIFLLGGLRVLDFAALSYCVGIITWSCPHQSPRAGTLGHFLCSWYPGQGLAQRCPALPGLMGWAGIASPHSLCACGPCASPRPSPRSACPMASGPVCSGPWGREESA